MMVLTNEKMLLPRFLFLLFHQCGAGVPGSSALESFENHCDGLTALWFFTLPCLSLETDIYLEGEGIKSSYAPKLLY